MVVGESRGRGDSDTLADTPAGGEREEEKEEKKEGVGEGEGGGATLAEERLKWQMEMENLRRECETREAGERERCAVEVREWREKVAELEKKCREIREQVEEGKEREGELAQAKERSENLQILLVVSSCTLLVLINTMLKLHYIIVCVYLVVFLLPVLSLCLFQTDRAGGRVEWSEREGSTAAGGEGEGSGRPQEHSQDQQNHGKVSGRSTICECSVSFYVLSLQETE